MKTTAIFTLLLSVSVVAATRPRIPSRKVAAPTHSGYTVPAASPTVSSRKVVTPTISSSLTFSRAKSVVSVPAPEPIRPKIMSPPVAPLPKNTIQEEPLPVINLEATAASIVLQATPTENAVVLEGSAVSKPLIATAVMQEQIVHELLIDESTAGPFDARKESLANNESKALELIDPKNTLIAINSEDTVVMEAVTPQELVFVEPAASPKAAEESSTNQEPTCATKSCDYSSEDTDAFEEEEEILVAVKRRV